MMKKVMSLVPTAACVGGAVNAIAHHDMSTAVGFVNLAALLAVLDKLRNE